jgi:hypothetical protein
VNKKNRTLLRMDDSQSPAIFVEVIATEFEGYRIIFQDYQVGDAPVLIVNGLPDENLIFCQADEKSFFSNEILSHALLICVFVLFRRTQLLPSSSHVLYTWIDPMKKRELSVLCGNRKATLDLTVISFNRCSETENGCSSLD